MDSFSFEKTNFIADLYPKIYHYISNIMFTKLYNEPLSEMMFKNELFDILRIYNFSIEDVYELNDCFKGENNLYKFNHLSPATRTHFIYSTNKLLK